MRGGRKLGWVQQLWTFCPHFSLVRAGRKLGWVQRNGHRATQRETVPEPRTKWDESTPNDWSLSRQAQANLRAINRAPEIVGRLKSIFSPNHKKQQKDPRKAAFVRGKNTLLTTRI